MSSGRCGRLVLAVAVLAVLAGCAAPRSTVNVPTTAAAQSRPLAATAITPGVPVSSTAGATAGEWPPILAFGPIEEAGTTTITAGKVSLEIPSGYTKTAEGTYSGTDPDTAKTGTITLMTTSSTGEAASDQLNRAPSMDRIAELQIANAASSAIGETVKGATQTWSIGIVTNDGSFARATFSSPADAFKGLLMYQSAGSIKVAA